MTAPEVCAATAHFSQSLFSGKERDAESGLDNSGARYFGSALGRFMSADNGIDQDSHNPQSWNLYSYVRNNPLKYTDPDGHDCFYINPDSGGRVAHSSPFFGLSGGTANAMPILKKQRPPCGGLCLIP